MLIMTLASLSLVCISLYKMDCQLNNFRHNDEHREKNIEHRNSKKSMISLQKHDVVEIMHGSDDSSDCEGLKLRKQKNLKRSFRTQDTDYDRNHPSIGANLTKSSLHDRIIPKSNKVHAKSSVFIPITNAFFVQPTSQKSASCSLKASRKGRKKSNNTCTFTRDLGHEEIPQHVLSTSSHLIPIQSAYTNSPRPSITRESSYTTYNRLRNSSESSTHRETVRNVTPIDYYSQEDGIEGECTCSKCLNGPIPSDLNAQTYEINDKKKQTKRRSSYIKNLLGGPQKTKDYSQYNGRNYTHDLDSSQDRNLRALREQQIAGNTFQTNQRIGGSTGSLSSLTNFSTNAKSSDKNELSEHDMPKVTLHRIGNESDSDSNTLR
ncbi:hypothetical protein COBT_000363 [Conglomerata obtusa]